MRVGGGGGGQTCEPLEGPSGCRGMGNEGWAHVHESNRYLNKTPCHTMSIGRTDLAALVTIITKL